MEATSGDHRRSRGRAFLTDLAVTYNVSASTQNQAQSALLFLYKDVLGDELPWLDGVERAKRAFDCLSS
jgi:Phage integrase, N-terminal SAM-like domain